jgi:hypothetical protein
VAPSASEKLDSFITQIKQMIQDDVRKERATEILNMFRPPPATPALAPPKSRS